MQLKISLSLFLLNILMVNTGIAQKKTAVINSRDLVTIIGCWEGSLTYLDYSSNKPYTMAANVNIQQTGNSNTFIFSNIYPKEPNANSADTVIITDGGKKLNDETVVSKQKNADGSLVIVTEVAGTDGNDNKPAVIRHTYMLEKKNYTVRKDVRFVAETKWINRHEYTYSRKTCD